MSVRDPDKNWVWRAKLPVLSPDNWSEDCDLATSGVRTVEARPEGIGHKVAAHIHKLTRFVIRLGALGALICDSYA